jgi:hypothetical protein
MSTSKIRMGRSLNHTKIHVGRLRPETKIEKHNPPVPDDYQEHPSKTAKIHLLGARTANRDKCKSSITQRASSLES